MANSDRPKANNRELKEVGLKVTLPRLRVLGLLHDEPDRHWSAEDVYRALAEKDSDIGLATVYRVLTQFEAAGLLIRHRFDNGHARFELDSGDHHDHLVCVSCGRIVEFVEPTIEQRQAAVAKQHGFQISDHSLVIYGLCQACRSEGEA